MAPRLVLGEEGRLVLENIVGDDVFRQELGVTRQDAIQALATLDTLGSGLTLTIGDGRIGVVVKGLSVSAAAAELVALAPSEVNTDQAPTFEELRLLEALTLTPSFGDERGTVREDPKTGEVVFIFSVAEVGGERKVVRLGGCAHLREHFEEQIAQRREYTSWDGIWHLVPAPEGIGPEYFSVVQVKTHLGYIEVSAMRDFIQLGGSATEGSIDPDAI